MRISSLSIALASLLSVAPASASSPSAIDPVAYTPDPPSQDIAMQIVTGLATDIGPRMAGSEAEAQARDWAVKKLRALGFADVRIEPFEFSAWVRGAEEAALITPQEQSLSITALGNSGATGPDGVEGEIVYFQTLDELKAAPVGSLSGKIAFIDNQMEPTQDGSGYRAYGPVRWYGPQIASERGAAAVLIRSIGTDEHDGPHAGNTTFSPFAVPREQAAPDLNDVDQSGQSAQAQPTSVMVTRPIPAAALSNADADQLVPMIEYGQRAKMRMLLTPRQVGQRPSGNVVAELKGSNPDLPAIVLACHLDSWDLGTGAIDDAAGCGIITAAAKHVARQGQPKRTIKLLWAGAEEVGAYGGRAFAEAHRDEAHSLAMESDFGADRVWRVDFGLSEDAAALADEIAARLLILGVVRGEDEPHAGADISALVAEQELGLISLRQDGMRYFDIHHSAEDQLDNIDPDQLRQNVAAWAAVLDLIANYEAQLRP